MEEQVLNSNTKARLNQSGLSLTRPIRAVNHCAHVRSSLLIFGIN